MARTPAVDRPDFHAWRAYRAVVDAESATEQAAVFQFVPEGRGRAAVWIHGGKTGGIRIGSVQSKTVEFTDPATGIVRRRNSYSAIADALVTNGTISPAAPIITGLDSRSSAAALLYGRWIERRARYRRPAAAVNAIALLAEREDPGVPVAERRGSTP